MYICINIHKPIESFIFMCLTNQRRRTRTLYIYHAFLNAFYWWMQTDWFGALIGNAWREYVFHSKSESMILYTWYLHICEDNKSAKLSEFINIVKKGKVRSTQNWRACIKGYWILKVHKDRSKWWTCFYKRGNRRELITWKTYRLKWHLINQLIEVHCWI